MLAAFAVPLPITGCLLLWRSSATADWRLFGSFAFFLLLGPLGLLIRRLKARRRDGNRHRGTVDAGTRAAILAEVPEFAPLTMLVRGTGVGLAVDGRRLLVGTRWMKPALPNTKTADERVFALAHEARHLAVWRSGVLRGFRLVRAAHLSTAAFIYTSVLLNVALILDDPDRLAFMASIFMLPWVAGALRAVLDAATNALEWRFEMDADAYAVHRCLSSGCSRGIPTVVSTRSSLDRSGLHPPDRLRAAGLRGASTRRVQSALLFTGWLSVMLPLLMTVVFEFATSDRPDLLTALLALLGLVSVSAAAVAVLTAGRPGGEGSTRAMANAASVVWLRVYLTEVRLVFCAVAVLASALSIVSVAKWQGTGTDLQNLLWSLAIVLAAATFWKAGVVPLRGRWVIAAASLDALRLWSMAWFLRATGVLPFFDDLSALGAAIQDHPAIIGIEMARMWREEVGWLVGAAGGIVLVSVGVAISVLAANSIITASGREWELRLQSL